MKKLFVLLSSVLIVGCATTKPSLIENTKPTTQQKVYIDKEVLKDCKILDDKLNSGDSFERTLVLRAEDIKNYYECYLLNKNKKKIIEEYLLNERPQ